MKGRFSLLLQRLYLFPELDVFRLALAFHRREEDAVGQMLYGVGDAKLLDAFGSAILKALVLLWP